MTAGSHTYCYVVSSVDPFGAINTPSHQTCIGGEPALSGSTTHNELTTDGLGNRDGQIYNGFTPAYLWYVSEDNGPWQLVSVSEFTSNSNDFGQRTGSRGGWPDNIPLGSLDISRNEDFFTKIIAKKGSLIAIKDPLPSQITSSLIEHDDTDSIQAAINQGVQAGGARILLGKGDYNIKRPYVHSQDGTHNSNLAYAWYQTVGYLYLADTATGRISLEGSGADTVIHTPPDHDSSTRLWDFGAPVAPNPPYVPIGIEEVVKGATTLTLLPGADPASPKAGDDIEIFSGNFGDGSCQAVDGEAANCHYSELNTVASRDGSTITLVYPTSKHFWIDGMGSSLGISVRTYPTQAVIPHMIALQHLTVDTFNPLISTGDVFGLLINDVHVTGSVSQGIVYGGAKRDITIMNSSWSQGAGDSGYNDEQEMDKWTNAAMLNNVVTGTAAVGAEGLGQGARLNGTEGSSRFSYIGNTFNNLSVYFDQTTDDLIRGNTFNNGIVTAGFSYGTVLPGPCFAPFHDGSFLSFASQENLIVDHNVYNISADYNFPYIIRAGDFTSASIELNTINYTNYSEQISLVVASGGTVRNNMLNLSVTNRYTVPFCLLPDESPNTPPRSFFVTDNIVTGSPVAVGIGIPDTAFTDPAPICTANNSFSQAQDGLLAGNPQALTLSCSE